MSCLLCSSPEVTPTSSSGDNSTSILEYGTEVIFLLRQLLHLPSTSCEELLISHGHPGNWIDLCQPCSSLLTQARDLYLQITRLQSEFQGIQTTLRVLVGVKREPFQDNDNDKATYRILTLLSEIESSGLQVPNVVDDDQPRNDDLVVAPPSITEKRRRKGKSIITGRKAKTRQKLIKKGGQNEEETTDPKRGLKARGRPKKNQVKLLQQEIKNESFWPDDPDPLLLGVDPGDEFMGEEILPQTNSSPFQQFEEPEEEEIPDPLDPSPISSGSEYCASEEEYVCPAREDDTNVTQRRTRTRTRCKGEVIEVEDFTRELKSTRKSTRPRKVTPLEPPRKTGRIKYKPKMRRQKNTTKSGSRKKKAGSNSTWELKEYDIEIPVQPTWIWNDFVVWRKSQVIEFRRAHPKTVDERQNEISRFVPTLEWLARKYQIKSFPCPGCGENFASLSDLKSHGPKACSSPYQCWWEDCEVKFTCKYHLETHIRGHLPLEDVTCLGCGISYPELKDFNAHIAKSVTQGQDQSSICLQKAIICTKCPSWVNTNYFSSQSLLDIHICAKHAPKEELPFVCNTCGSRFSALGCLKRHNESTHNLNPGQNLCEQCAKTFKSQYHLNYHIQMVHGLPGAKRYTCDICGKQMFSMGKLNRHRQIHISPEDAPHLCTLCGKRFRLREYLNIHMRSHDPEKHLKYPSKKREPGTSETRGLSDRP